MTNNAVLNFWKDISPEARLLIKSAKISFTEVQHKEIKLFINEVKDWKLFQRLALQTSLAPLCYKSLVTSGDYSIPEETASFLKRVYTKILAQNILILDEYDRLKVILDQAEIPYVPLKGVRLIGEYYKDAGLRNTSDVDLLFRKSDLETVRKLMKVNGYKEYIVDEYLRISELTQNPSPYQYFKNNVSIDFHILLNRVGKISLNIADYWSSATKKEDSFEFVLNPNLEFIHLCYHFYKHLTTGPTKLVWMLDLQLFHEKNKINWEKIQVQAKVFNCLEELITTINILEIIYESEGMPEEFRKNINQNFDIIKLINNNLVAKSTAFSEGSILKNLFRETSHLPLPKKFVVATLRSFPSMSYLNERFNGNNNYLNGLKNRYFQAFKIK
jgi:hypothetical protein